MMMIEKLIAALALLLAAISLFTFANAQTSWDRRLGDTTYTYDANGKSFGTARRLGNTTYTDFWDGSRNTHCQVRQLGGATKTNCY
jgi:YD repeat-containing protein